MVTEIPKAYFLRKRMANCACYAKADSIIGPTGRLSRWLTHHFTWLHSGFLTPTRARGASGSDAGYLPLARPCRSARITLNLPRPRSAPNQPTACLSSLIVTTCFLSSNCQRALATLAVHQSGLAANVPDHLASWWFRFNGKRRTKDLIKMCLQ